MQSVAIWGICFQKLWFSRIFRLLGLEVQEVDRVKVEEQEVEEAGDDLEEVREEARQVISKMARRSM